MTLDLMSMLALCEILSSKNMLLFFSCNPRHHEVIYNLSVMKSLAPSAPLFSSIDSCEHETAIDHVPDNQHKEMCRWTHLVFSCIKKLMCIVKNGLYDP